MKHTRAAARIPAARVGISIAALFGLLFGGGASASHAERSAAVTPNMTETILAPLSSGVVASTAYDPSDLYALARLDLAIAITSRMIDPERAAADWQAEQARIEAERVAAEEVARQEAARQVAARPVRPVVQTSWPTSLEPCGGDLPPCYVKWRESHGDYNAQNPTSTASGAWQFLDSTWNGFGGYARAVYAPPEVQDEKARLVWAGGAGCSAWSAC